ncbi:uncharacterized protein LOC119163898 [Rhipicephalus microplus]|uniref:uncharacterized protein LOC119163898 n=1 Tax=Rhipicephalus microplus TaxID=6941 RepID=UPI00188816D0|nr:activating transcription factor 3-like [Rhipicephalus microplus]
MYGSRQEPLHRDAMLALAPNGAQWRPQEEDETHSQAAWAPCDASWATPRYMEDETLLCIPRERSVLIKNCLKLTIKQRREALGLGDIEPEYKEPGPDHLTKEDEEKRRRRRERNKIAASKCRNRKKERTVRLCEESEGLQRGNAELRRELQRLRLEVQHLTSLLRLHVCIATPAVSASTEAFLGGGASCL